MWALGQKQSVENDDGIAFILGYTNPAFFNNSDSVFLQKNLDKYYSLYSYIYAQEQKAGISTQDQQMADSLALYIRKRYVADKYLQQLSSTIAVSQEEIHNYYKQHLEDYSAAGVCTYYQVFLMQEDAETIKKAKAKVLELNALPDSVMPFKGEKNTMYSISLEKNVKLNPSYQITSTVEHIPVQTFSELVQIPGFNFKTMYYVTDRTNTSTLPFSEVKEDCLNKARAVKLQTQLDELYSKSKAQFPSQRR